MIRPAAWLAVAAALAGCTYNPSIRAGVIECQPDGPPCPAPYVCVKPEGETRGLCDLPGNAADAAAPPADAGSPGGGKPDLAPGGPEAGPPGPDTAAPVPDTGAPPDGPAADVPAPPDAPPASPDLRPDAPPAAAFVCPLGRGPDMVNVGSAVPFCIDTTEVTNLQYKVFLDDPKIDLRQQHERCIGRNTSFAPSTSDGGGLNVTTRADHPVINVDWCDAHAFCKWAGKRLCGSITGGPLEAGAATVPTVSQWSHACTRGGINSFPYGLTFNPTACNIGRPEFPIGTVPVRSKTGCVGGFVGMFDMVGNVEEWVDFCRNDPTEGWVCGVMGGPYTAGQSEAHCGEFYDDPMIDHWVARGFRCCAP